MNQIKIIAITVIVLFIFSCNKNDVITYGSPTIYGDNLLSLSGQITISKPYSFGAKLEKSATLKIILTNLSVQTNTSQPLPIWYYNSADGWSITNYDFTNNVQTFVNSRTDHIDLQIGFAGTPGVCKIDFYENSNNITKTKQITW